MFDNWKDMADWKSIGLKALVYIMLIVSFSMFGKGWLTFESSRTRNNISKEAKGLAKQTEDLEDYEWENLTNALADDDLDITAEDFVKRTHRLGMALEDAELSPKEAMTLMGDISWLGNRAGEEAGFGKDSETKKAISQAGLYNIVLHILYIVTVLCFWGSIFALVTGAGIGTHAYTAAVLIEFCTFLLIKLRMEKFMDKILGNMGGTTNENMAMKLCAPAFVSLIFAVLASVAWIVLQSMCRKEGKEVPRLLSLYKKGSKGAMQILPKGPVCACGAKLDKNAKFCAVCGREVPAEAPAGNVCHNCGTELEPDSLFCPKCGQRVAAPAPASAPVRPEPKAAPVCPGCGKPVEPDALFCAVCGTRLGDNEDRTFIPDSASANINVGPRLLTLTSAEDASKQFSRQIFEGNRLSVGRQKDSDIVIDFNGSVSRKHCSVFVENGEVYLKDEGSSYGTSVNDQTANSPMMLHNGDTITLGNCKLYVSLH